MFDRLKLMKETYLKIQEKLASGMTDIKAMTQLAKEASQLEDTVFKYDEYIKIHKQYEETLQLIEIEDDVSILEIAKEEAKSLSAHLQSLVETLKMLLIPKDPNDDKNVIMEIKGAAGGDEGNLFAGDLFRMYSRYAENMGWKLALINVHKSEMGGYTSIEFSVSGDKVYSFLKYESGVHRVQRVPETESQGRIHTSTAVVLALPEQEEIDIEVKWEDIRVDTFQSSGAGGQSVNTAYSAVRLTHVPTGIVSQSQEERSQQQNKERAYKLLVTRIYDKLIEEKLEKEGEKRKSLAGRGDRSEKIRTYNYPQNRVTDHRIGLTLNRLDTIMEGRVDLVIEPLINEFLKRQLEGDQSDT